MQSSSWMQHTGESRSNTEKLNWHFGATVTKILCTACRRHHYSQAYMTCLLLEQQKDSNPQLLLPHCVVHANIHRIFLHIISLQGDCKAVNSLCKDCSLMMQVEHRYPNQINAQQGDLKSPCSSDPPHIGESNPVTRGRHFFFFSHAFWFWVCTNFPLCYTSQEVDHILCYYVSLS